MKINERQMPSKQESMGRTYASPSIKADGGDASQLCKCHNDHDGVHRSRVPFAQSGGLRQRVILPPPCPPGAPLSATPHFKGGSPPAAAAGAADGDTEAAKLRTTGGGPNDSDAATAAATDGAADRDAEAAGRMATGTIHDFRRWMLYQFPPTTYHLPLTTCHFTCTTYR